MSEQTRLAWLEQYNHPKWKELRTRRKKEGRWYCENCGCKDWWLLRLHHRYYLNGKELWDYPDYMLEVLCESCHEDHHKAEFEIKKLCGFLNNDKMWLFVKFARWFVSLATRISADLRKLPPRRGLRKGHFEQTLNREYDEMMEFIENIEFKKDA